MIHRTRTTLIHASRTALLPALLAASIGIGPSPALAMDDYRTGALTWRSDVSGFATGQYKEFIAPDGFALQGIQSRETSRIAGNDSNDNPMFLSVGSGRLCTMNEQDCSAPVTYSPTGATLRIAESNITSSKDVTLGARRYITGIRVCNKDANRLENRKLKGIQIIGGTINNQGNVASNLNDDFTRPNCRNNWSHVTQCRNGKYVKGIRAYYGSKGYVGIGVLCARATPPSSGNTATISGTRGTLQRR